MWLPHTTVAAIVAKDDQFLMVKEYSNGIEVYNQPAGHLEANESLVDACIRETHEETGWKVEPVAFLGISQYTAPQNNVTYIRHSFIANPLSLDSDMEIDKDIISTHWMTFEEIQLLKLVLRSELVLRDINKYRNGTRYPLTILS